MNRGVIIIIYISKYIIVMIGLLIDIVLVIHPMWVMEEYAISDLNFD